MRCFIPPDASVKEAQKIIKEFFSSPHEIKGKTVRRTDAKYAHSWKGMELTPSQSPNRISNSKRLKECSEAKRTLDVKVTAKPLARRMRKHLTYMSEKNTINLQDMIHKGYSGESLGNITGRISRDGKVFYGLSSSFDNSIHTSSLKEVYKRKDAYENLGEKDKKKAKKTVEGIEHLRDSQLVTLPGKTRVITEPKRSVRVPQFLRSQIDTLSGVMKPSAVSLQAPDIKKPLSRDMLTSLQREQLIGSTPERTQRKIVTQPRTIEIMNRTRELLANTRFTESTPRTRDWDLHKEIGFGVSSSQRQSSRSCSRGARRSDVQDLRKTTFTFS